MNLKEKLLTFKNKILKINQQKQVSLLDAKKSNGVFAFKHVYINDNDNHIKKYISTYFTLPYQISIEDGFKIISFYHDEVCKHFEVEPFSKQAIVLLRALINLSDLHFNSTTTLEPIYLLSITNSTEKEYIDNDNRLYRSWYTQNIDEETIKQIYENSGYKYERIDFSSPDEYDEQKLHL